MTHQDRIAWCQRHPPAENNAALHLAATWYAAMPDDCRHPGATVLLELAIVCIEHARERVRRGD